MIARIPCEWASVILSAIGKKPSLAIALPWYVAIWFATDGAFYAKAIGYSVTEKITSGMQAHGFPPGYYFLLFWVTSWPIGAVAASALPSLWRDRSSADIRFLAAWVLPVWIVYELIATKLPHYVLPIYPAIALAAASAFAGGRIDADRAWVRLLFILAALGPVAFVTGAAGGFLALEGSLPPPIVPLAAAVAGCSILALRLIQLRKLISGWLVLAAIVAPLTYASLFGVLAPRLESLWISPRLAAASAAVAGCTDPAVISVGHGEASLIFAVGTDIRFGGTEEAAAFLAGGACRAAIVEQEAEEAFSAELAKAAVTSGPVRRVEGLSIANGRRLDFGVYGSPR